MAFGLKFVWLTVNLTLCRPAYTPGLHVSCTIFLSMYSYIRAITRASFSRCLYIALRSTRPRLSVFTGASVHNNINRNNLKLSYCCDRRSYCMQEYGRLKHL